MKITKKILEKIIKEELQAVIEDKNEMSFTEKEVEDFDRKQTAAEKGPIGKKDKMIADKKAKCKKLEGKAKAKCEKELKKLEADLAGPGASTDQSGRK